MQAAASTSGPNESASKLYSTGLKKKVVLKVRKFLLQKKPITIARENLGAVYAT